MVSESVTNALVHGTGRISLRIDVASDALRVEVSDQHVRARAQPDARRLRRGPRIVDQLADEHNQDDHDA